MDLMKPTLRNMVHDLSLMSLGIIGNYIGKIYMEVKHRPRYIISERTWENDGDQTDI